MVKVIGCRGFTLAELLVATAVTIVALSLAAALLGPAAAAFHALPEAIDTQERLRIAAQVLSDDISGAGAGPVLGWAARATPAWPAVLPCRWAGEHLTAVTGGCGRQDAISIPTMAVNAPQAALAEDLAAPGAAMRLSALSSCALSQTACRFHEDARALVADGTGAWDVLPITAVSADGLLIEHAGAALPRLYRAGAIIGETGLLAYSLRVDPTSLTAQLRRSSNGSADMPLVDHVTQLRFEYFGAAAPPAVFDDGDHLLRRTSYGPLPPPDGSDDTLDRWPPGENCLFSRFAGAPSPRQVPLPEELNGLARLPVSFLADGPWCPDDAAPNRYDADLLRVRLVRVTLRVQAQSPAARGLDARLFNQPGSAREASRLVPDLEIRVDVALRNR
jgi:hypothetical protein